MGLATQLLQNPTAYWTLPINTQPVVIIRSLCRRQWTILHCMQKKESVLINNLVTTLLNLFTEL